MSDEHVDPGTFSYTLAEHIADVEGEDNAESYLAEVVDDLFVLVPGLRQRFSDELLGELKEEIVRREDSKHAHATVELIKAIEQDWRNQA